MKTMPVPLVLIVVMVRSCTSSMIDMTNKAASRAVAAKEAARSAARSSSSSAGSSSSGESSSASQSSPPQGIMTVDGSVDPRLGQALSSTWQCRTCRLGGSSNKYSVSVDDRDSPAMRAKWVIKLEEPTGTAPCINQSHEWENVTPGAPYITYPKYGYDWRGDYARQF